MGVISNVPLGIYTYGKHQRSGVVLPATVEVYSLEVSTQLKKWPERKQRRLEWLDVRRRRGWCRSQGCRC